MRNNWYLELIFPFLEVCKKTKKFWYFCGNKKISWILKKDLAEVGAKVIMDGCDKEILNLANKPISFKELGEELIKAINEQIEIKEVSKNEYKEWIKTTDISKLGLYLTETYQDYLLAGNNGEEDATSEDMESIIQHPVTPYSEAIKYLFEHGNCY